MLDRDSVDIVNFIDTPIKTFNETGVLLDTQMDFDAVVLATGFDSFSGSWVLSVDFASWSRLVQFFPSRLFKMGLRNRDGQDIRHVWQDGIRTYLGTTFHGFPNTFMVYSPQGKTSSLDLRCGPKD